MPSGAVIFDMDGVLVDTADAHYASWKMLAAEHGIEISRDEFLSTFGRPTREIIRQRFDKNLTDEQIRVMDERKEAAFRSQADTHVKLIPHARELIVRLHEQGTPLAIGSSAPPPNVDLVLDMFSVRSFFSALVTGQDVTRGKPDPQVFLLAAEKLGVEPGRCVVIEDAMAGIDAARAAGMTAVALTTSHPARSFSRAHVVVDSLADLDVDRLFVA